MSSAVAPAQSPAAPSAPAPSAPAQQPGPGVPPALHPFAPFGRLHPDRAWEAVRAAGPAWPDPVSGLRLLTGQRLCRAALTDPAFSAAAGQRQRARDDDLPQNMLTTDSAEHRRLRGPTAAAFSARSVGRGTVVPAAVADAVAALPAATPQAGVDLVTAFCEPLAHAVLAGTIGIPAGAAAQFHTLAAAAAANLDPLVRGEAARRAAAASRRLQDFLAARRAAARESGAATDLGGLAWDAPLSDDERIAFLALLVVGGLEPLAAIVAATVHVWCVHPEVRRAVDSDPAVLARVVEETLRLHSPIPFTARVCRREFTDGTVTIPAGTPVLAVIAAANRDPEAYPDPTALRLDRPDAPGHLAFGAGAHFCLGAPLVRSAARQSVAALLRRFPTLAPAGPAAWTTGVPRRLHRLPVRW